LLFDLIKDDEGDTSGVPDEVAYPYDPNDPNKLRDELRAWFNDPESGANSK